MKIYLKENWQIVCAFTFLAVVFSLVIMAGIYNQKAHDKCKKTCDPQQFEFIQDKCACRTKDGWQPNKEGDL